MKKRQRPEARCDFCHRLLRSGESISNWQPYAAIDPTNVWYELIACPECRDDPKRRKQYYSAQYLRGD